MDPMTPTVQDPDVLAAFVDGALSPEEAARVVLHLADCPADAAHVDALAETNALLAAAYADPLHQPTPERLRAAIFPEAAAPARAAAARPGWRRLLTRRAGWTALAASVALTLGLAALPPSAPRGVQIALTPSSDAALRDALETLGSGAVAAASDDAQITPVATFLDRDGRACREYEVLDLAAGAMTLGLACRSADAVWSAEVEVASKLAAPDDRGDAFVPAAGPAAGALDDALDRIGAGMALSTAEEQALIAADWER